MKLITSVARPHRLDAAEEALEAAGGEPLTGVRASRPGGGPQAAPAGTEEPA